jgi:hypothetical protein
LFRFGFSAGGESEVSDARDGCAAADETEPEDVGFAAEEEVLLGRERAVDSVMFAFARARVSLNMSAASTSW